MALNKKQLAFVHAYVSNGCKNATQAYLTAGYKAKSENVAKAAASRLLTDVNVQSEIERLTKDARKQAEEENKRSEKKAIADLNEIQAMLTEIAREEATDENVVVVTEKSVTFVEDANGVPRRHEVSIDKPVKVETKARNSDRIAAMRELAKLQGGYTTDVNLVNAEPLVIIKDRVLD